MLAMLSPSMLAKLAATAAAAISTSVLILAVANPDHGVSGAPRACVYRHALAQADLAGVAIAPI